MQYLRIKKGKRTHADGSQWAEILVIHKNRKFGTVIEQWALSVKRPLLVTGPHDAGKARWLERLHKEAPLIWGTKSESPPLWLAAVRPFSAWTDVPQLAEWWDKRPHEGSEWGCLSGR